ncbi:MAG: ERCC4 domain-containing protein [Candidatus Micrarchaeia archaeon]
MNELVFEERSEVQVFIDDRELKSAAAKTLFEKGALLKPVRLSVGDYVLSARACVERKTAQDFESSVLDGRLFAQAQELREAFASPIIAVTGKKFERLQPAALRGAFISLAVDYKIPLLFFDSDAELAEFIYALGEREQLLEPREARVRFGRKGDSQAERQRFIVESLPLIGPKVARALLEHFGSIERLMSASAEELMEVDGVGGKRAEEIRRVLSSPYAP